MGSKPNFVISDDEILLFIESERLKTFTEWPNDLSWSCTPEKLAKAGFYFNPGAESLDNACCVFCHKELDGWEPDDDPVKEHKKHSPRCPFLSLRKPLEDLTLSEFMKFKKELVIYKAEKVFEMKRREYEAQAALTRETVLERLSKKQ